MLYLFKGEVIVFICELKEVWIDGVYIILFVVLMLLFIIDEFIIWINMFYGGKNEVFMVVRIELKLGVKQFIWLIDFMEDKIRN